MIGFLENQELLSVLNVNHLILIGKKRVRGAKNMIVDKEFKAILKKSLGE